MKERILIISNNCLSNTDNNGKTILSLFDRFPTDRISQLYFSEDISTFEGIKYFQLSDKDVLRGKLNSKFRGREYKATYSVLKSVNNRNIKPHSEFARFVRELIWIKGWKSKQLDKWLDKVSPTHVFFVAGDCCFAYRIFNYIAKKYDSKNSIYVTDDYFVYRKKENFFSLVRRKWLRFTMKNSLKHSKSFFTISEAMRTKYKELFSRDSFIIFNMVEAVGKIDVKEKADDLTIVYAGSLYYEREKSLQLLAKIIAQYKLVYKKNIHIEVYGDYSLVDLAEFDSYNCVSFKGLLPKDELYSVLKKCDILLFMESFNEEMIEKVKYSFSTKIPEYLSLGKPILAIGPSEIASIEYLKDVSKCITNLETAAKEVFDFFNNQEERTDLAKKAIRKYEKNHDKEKIQREFIKHFL